MNTADTLSTFRTQLSERREARLAARLLREELASYSTPAERLELDAILGRHTEAEIAELEALMTRGTSRIPTQR